MMNRPNSVQKSIVRAISLYAGRISFNAGSHNTAAVGSVIK